MVKEDPRQAVIENALAQGVEAFVKRHPQLKDQRHRIQDHIDLQRFREGAQGIEEYLQQEEQKLGKAVSPQEHLKRLHQGLVDYVVAGRALDDDGKEILLLDSLEHRAMKGPRALEARTQLKGERYLQKVGVAFRELYEMFKSGDYAQHMPEVARAVVTVRNLGFLSPALDVMRHYGLINDKRYAFLKKNIFERVEKGTDDVNTAMEQVVGREDEKVSSDKNYRNSQQKKDGRDGYSHRTPIRNNEYSHKEKIIKADFDQERPYHHSPLEKIAAVVLGMAGLVVMLFAGTRFTGNVIGASTGETLLPFAGIFLCAAAWLVLGTMRRSRSRNTL